MRNLYTCLSGYYSLYYFGLNYSIPYNETNGKDTKGYRRAGGITYTSHKSEPTQIYKRIKKGYRGIREGIKDTKGKGV